jgi:formylmethanofuran dehydrogenase subunit C
VIPSIEILGNGESCLGDFTFDFYWQHQGSRLDPDGKVSGTSYCRMVDALKSGETVSIRGDAGSRLGSSMGVSLKRLGGTGGPLEGTGTIVVDGDVGSRMGISMLRGKIYVSGNVQPPLGNVIEVESDRSGFRKFISITEALLRDLDVASPNTCDGSGLAICDGVLRDTVGARNEIDKTIRIQGEAGMSTGILLSSGSIDISGGAGQNTGVLMRGGRVVVRGSCQDFTGAEMRGGEIFVEKNAGSFTCARMKGGNVYAREAKPVPPARAYQLSPSELATVGRTLCQAPLYAMMYRRFGL